MILLKRSGFVSMAALLLAFAVMLSGCSSDSKSTADTLKTALEKSAEIKSYAMSGSLKVQDLKLPDEAAEQAGELSMLKGAELSWTGAYRADPMLVEATLKLTVSDSLSFQIPIIMNGEKLWVRIPNIPMLPLPDDIANKFVELDLKKLAEEQGTEWPGDLSIGKTSSLMNDVYGIVFKHIDEKTYLSEKSAKDAGISEDKKLKTVVQLHVAKDQVEPLVNTVLKDIAPEVIDLLASNEEYRKLLQVEPKDLDEAKKKLGEVEDKDVKRALEEFNKSVKSLDAVVNYGIDKDGYASYADATLTGEVAEDGQTGSGTIKLVSEQTDINKEPKFEYGEPKAEDIVPMEKLGELFGGLIPGLGAGLDGSDGSDL